MEVKPSDKIIGRKVMVKSCEASEHGDNEGCVCHLIGKNVLVTRRYRTPFVGTTSYHLLGRKQRVRRNEVVLLKKQPVLSSISAFLFKLIS
ncbi:hypothetical protein ACFL3E_00010 [Patescibacteria group bacterium]